MENPLQAYWSLLFFIPAICLYFLPSLIACNKKNPHPNKVAIVVINLFFGWVYGIGWIIALIWALCKPEPTKVIQVKDNFDKLKELAELKEKGILTEEEFLKEKQKLLKDEE